MDLRELFDITDRLLDNFTVKRTQDELNEILVTSEFNARGLVTQAKVKLMRPIDDPVHDLAHPKAAAADTSFKSSMLPI